VGRQPRSLADENRSRFRELLQAGRDVDRVAAHDQLATGSRFPTGDDLTRVDADSQTDVSTMLPRNTFCELREHVSNRECGAHRALCVVLMCLRNAEHREDRVTHELLAHAPIALDLRVHELE